MRMLVWFTYFWSKLLLLIPVMKKAERADREGDAATRDAILNKHVTQWANSLLKLAGADVTVVGRENIPDEPVVFVSNHQGSFDIPLLLTQLDKPHGLVAKDATEKLPLIRNWMRLLGCVFIDRSNPRQSVTALNEAARRLTEEGRSFIIFPEGTRSQGPKIGEFKNGGFKIAFKSGAKIVPVCISGSYKLMEANKNWIRPASVRVTILPPVATQGLSREELKEMTDRVHEIIENAL